MDKTGKNMKRDSWDEQERREFIRLIRKCNEDQRAALFAFMIATINREAIERGFIELETGGMIFNIILN